MIAVSLAIASYWVHKGDSQAKQKFWLSGGGTLRLIVDASNPLGIPGTPAINAMLDITLQFLDSGQVISSVKGQHDAFPAYELYVQKRLVYSFDPASVGTTPGDLLPAPFGKTVHVDTPVSTS